MDHLSPVEFEQKVSPRVAMEAVRSFGACAVHHFATDEQLQVAADLLRTQPMDIDENMASKVQRRQRMSAYTLSTGNAPRPLEALASEVTSYVNRGNFIWTPNELIAHRYESQDFIGRHRDYTEAYGLVAVLTVEGIQDFYVELDHETEPTKITMEPGTLTMLRGFTGNPEKRPYHWVDKPIAQRSAISIRDMRHVWTPGESEWA